jgi:hypothetical protein
MIRSTSPASGSGARVRASGADSGFVFVSALTSARAVPTSVQPARMFAPQVRLTALFRARSSQLGLRRPTNRPFVGVDVAPTFARRLPAPREPSASATRRKPHHTTNQMLESFHSGMGGASGTQLSVGR